MNTPTSIETETMTRYVLQTAENEYIKWIQWTAGIIPTIVKGNYQEAMIVSDDYLNYKNAKTGETREQLILEEHPYIDILEVTISLTNKKKQT